MVRNLLYHIMPKTTWEWNVDQLAKRIQVFTGKLIFSIAHGAGLEELESVKRKILTKLPFTIHQNIIFIQVQNDRKLGEAKSFPSLLSLASKFDRTGITFYAHAKGVTRPNHPSVTLWTDALYHFNLDNIEKVEALLKSYPIIGAFKRYGKFAQFPRNSLYHFSGSFYWFRNKDLFARDWTQIPQRFYATEAYPSLIFTKDEAGCIYGDRFQDGYKWEYMKGLLQNDPYFRKFIVDNDAAGIKFDKFRKKLKRV